MLYDIRTSPEQLKQLGEWVSVGKDMADVELVADDRMLLAQQADDRMAWDTDGSPASDEYLAVAPLDGPPRWGLMTADQLVQTIRAALAELHGRTDAPDCHTLDLALDRWDEYENERGEQ